MSDAEQNPTLIYCDICDVHISGENNFNVHVLGKKHVRKSLNYDSQNVRGSSSVSDDSNPWKGMINNLYHENNEEYDDKTPYNSANNKRRRPETESSSYHNDYTEKSNDHSINSDDSDNPWKTMMSRMKDGEGNFAHEYIDEEDGELNAKEEREMDEEAYRKYTEEVEIYEKACAACGPELRCTCCGEVYFDPVRLTCGHLIDRGCAESKKQFGFIITCPMCKKRIYSKDVDEFPTDNDVACQLPPPPRDPPDRYLDSEESGDGNYYDEDRRKRKRGKKRVKDKKKKARQRQSTYEEEEDDDDDEAFSNNWRRNFSHSNNHSQYSNQQHGWLRPFAPFKRHGSANVTSAGFMNVPQRPSNPWDDSLVRPTNPYARPPLIDHPTGSQMSKNSPMTGGLMSGPGGFGTVMPTPPSSGGLMPTPAGAGGLMPTPAGAGGLMPTPTGPGGLMPTPTGAGGLMPTPTGPGGLMPTPTASGGLMSTPAGSGVRSEPTGLTSGDTSGGTMTGGFQLPVPASTDRDAYLRQLFAQEKEVVKAIHATRAAKVALSATTPANQVNSSGSELLRQQAELQRLREEVEEQKRLLAEQQKALQERLAPPSKQQPIVAPNPPPKLPMPAATKPTANGESSSQQPKSSKINAVEQVTQLYQQAFDLYQKALKVASQDGAESSTSKEAIRQYSEAYENLVALQNTTMGSRKTAAPTTTATELDAKKTPASASKSDQAQLSTKVTPHVAQQLPADEPLSKRIRIGSETPSNQGSTPSSSQDETEHSPHLRISGLQIGTKATTIKDLCASYGRVVSIKIVGTRKTGVPQIYAYVTMNSSSAASKVALELSGYNFFGNILETKRIKNLPFMR